MKRVIPAPGQESVWDYPRPPRLEACNREIRIVFGGQTIVTTREAQRVLETSHPPVYYIPVDAVRAGAMRPTNRQTFCEWKGIARYYDVVVDDFIAQDAAWGYESPVASFAALRDHVAIYAHLMDACYVDGQQVRPQAGGFYGGWVTSDVVGPFKGEPGTRGW